MADLLCCPFCGSDAFVLSRENGHWAYCNNDECGAETQGKTTHSDAAAAWNRRSTLSDAVAECEAEPVAWQPMDTAPKGCVTEDAGIRGASEWFFGRVSPEFRKQGAAPFVVIRRRAWPQEDSWCCNGEAHYVPRYFDAWAPLYTTPPTSELEALRKRVAELEKVAEARVAELGKALEPFADIAGKVWADENGWTDDACQNDRICDWFGPSDFLAARRVREGGKVE